VAKLLTLREWSTKVQRARPTEKRGDCSAVGEGLAVELDAVCKIEVRQSIAPAIEISERRGCARRA